MVEMKSLSWKSNAKLAGLVQGPNRNAPILCDKSDELLSNVLHIVVLLQTANICFDRGIGWLADGATLTIVMTVRFLWPRYLK